jgi:hypothetical protein
VEVQAEIRARLGSDKKTLLEEANASAKRNLISVGGCADTPVHVDAAGNADGKRPCLGNGQTVIPSSVISWRLLWCPISALMSVSLLSGPPCEF